MVALLMLSCSTGTLDALYLITLGGKIPGGRTRRMVWEMAVTWAIASSTFTFG